MESAVNIFCKKKDSKCVCPREKCGKAMDESLHCRTIPPEATSSDMAYRKVCTCPSCGFECVCKTGQPKLELKPNPKAKAAAKAKAKAAAEVITKKPKSPKMR